MQLTIKSPGEQLRGIFCIIYENEVIHSDNILLFMVKYQ